MATTQPDTDRLRRIDGRQNALVKELRQAFDRGELPPAGEFAVEGFRIIEEAVRSGLRFRAIFFSELAQARTSRLLPQIGAHVETLILPDKLFRSIVPSETPQGVAALVTAEILAEGCSRSHCSRPSAEIAGVQTQNWAS
jgi:TrmH family RNA methyltransferase